MKKGYDWVPAFAGAGVGVFIAAFLALSGLGDKALWLFIPLPIVIMFAVSSYLWKVRRDRDE